MKTIPVPPSLQPSFVPFALVIETREEAIHLSEICLLAVHYRALAATKRTAFYVSNLITKELGK